METQPTQAEIEAMAKKLCAEYAKKYYEAHKEERRAYTKAYREKYRKMHPEKVKATNKAGKKRYWEKRAIETLNAEKEAKENAQKENF